MKQYLINTSIKITGIIVIIIAFMLKPAFCQTSTGIAGFALAVSGNEQAIFRLPGDIRPGDHISGTVVTDPKNNTPAQVNASSVLQGTVIEINGKQSQLSKRLISFLVPAGATIVPFIIKNASGQIVDRGQIPVNSSGFSLPPQVQFPQSVNNPGQIFFTQAVTQPGETVLIGGAFDGNAANTHILLNGNTCEVIAESPRMSYTEIPQNTPAGSTNITIQENKTSETSKINVVVIDLSADKLNLRKGEKTTIRVTVNGLNGIQFNSTPVKLNITNQSPQTISFLKETTTLITKEINTNAVTNGVYEFSTRITAVTTGTFTVMASLQSTGNDCVDKYLERMAQIKTDKGRAIENCKQAVLPAWQDASQKLRQHQRNWKKMRWMSF